MDVLTPPSLDLACPQAEADIEKYVHMFRDKGVDKIKYGHEGIMIILITATYFFLSYDFLCPSNNLSTMSGMNQKLHSKLTNYNLCH